MFVRPCYRHKDGKRHAYWSLVESYRTERGLHQRVVAYLGQLDEEGRLGVQEAAAPQVRGDERQQRLSFADERSYECSADSQPRWVTVNASAVRVENCVRFGGPWLALQLIKKLGLDDFLRRLPSNQTDVRWSTIALILAGHLDLRTALNSHPIPLPQVDSKQIAEFLRMLAEFMNLVLGYYTDSHADFVSTVHGPARNIVHALKEFKRLQELEHEREIAELRAEGP